MSYSYLRELLSLGRRRGLNAVSLVRLNNGALNNTKECSNMVHQSYPVVL